MLELNHLKNACPCSHGNTQSNQRRTSIKLYTINLLLSGVTNLFPFTLGCASLGTEKLIIVKPLSQTNQESWLPLPASVLIHLSQLFLWINNIMILSKAKPFVLVGISQPTLGLGPRDSLLPASAAPSRYCLPHRIPTSCNFSYLKGVKLLNEGTTTKFKTTCLSSYNPFLAFKTKLFNWIAEYIS